MIVHWEVLSYPGDDSLPGGFLLRVTDNRGCRGIGEARAIPGFGSGPDALGEFMTDAAAVGALVENLAGSAPVPVEARFAAESAINDLLAKAQGVSVCLLLGGGDVHRLRNSILVQAVDEAVQLAAKGHRQFKLKTHGESGNWREVFDAVVESTGGEAQFRLDANGTWDRKLARRQLAEIPLQNVVFVEQPFPVGDLESSAWLRRETGVAVALDEGAETPDDVRDIAATDAADVIVIKPMFRGMSGAIELARAAASHGLGTCFTHAMDGTVGRLAAMQIAAACADLPGGDWPHGLFAPGLPRLAEEPPMEGDWLKLSDAFGLGCEGLKEAGLTRVIQGFRQGPVPDPLAVFAAERPGHLALVTPGGTAIAAKSLDEACDEAASCLRQLGVSKGTVVGLDGAPTSEWLAALVACWRIGAVAAPLNHRSPCAERERAAGLLGCEAFWSASNDLESCATADRNTRSATPSTLDEALLRICTSGSTGTPRCVELTSGQMLFGATASALRLGHAADDRWLVCLPVNHVGALAAIYRCLNNGITLELHTGFDAATVGERLDSGDVSIVSLVPAMLESILDQRGAAAFPATLRAILLGGAACSDDLLERCRAASLPLALTWGMTEAGSQLATRQPGDLSDLENGLPPLPFVEVGKDGAGRLVVEGPMVRGTLVTGDFGDITAEGWVRVLGRADGVIIRGGENVLPEEVEAVLMGHPGLREAAVVGAPESRLGQVPVAFVAGDETDGAVLAAWCREKLDGFKVPGRFIPVERLPRTTTGKVDREALRNRVRQGAGSGSA